MSPTVRRRMPVGAELQQAGGTHFRVWAPRPRQVTLVLETTNEQRDVALAPEGDGYFSALVAEAVAGTRYRYRLDGDLVPDPASRFQPEGPFGPSEVIDAARFTWSDDRWPGVGARGQIVYEMHVGTFTREGTWAAAAERLPQLAQTGITVLELMPVAEFPGEFGWGYDGVFPYAPTRLYGTPDEFRAFVDQAHSLGLGVILDVVYNHMGPDGCVVSKYAKTYFSDRYDNEWGEALNFDGEESTPVREYFVANAAYWIAEYHLDGLRLDATQSIHDASEEHVIAAISKAVRQAAGGRSTLLVSENEPQHVRMVRPAEQGGYGLDMLWNDDFHHSACVAMNGRREAYYTDHRGTPQELISAAKYGYLFQGQRYAWQKKARGTRTDGVEAAAFVNFIENHDQLANSGDGSRLWQRTSPGRHRAMTALFLLMPGTPMLFQGQEFGASTPFLYFADHKPELAAAVQKGRGEFVAQFPSLAGPEMQEHLSRPHDRATFERCKLQWEEFDAHSTQLRLHTDLIALRKTDVAFRAQDSHAVDGAVLAAEAFLLRFATEDEQDERLLLVNLGPDLAEPSFAEPLVAAPDGYAWAVRWSSEGPEYGGLGTPQITGNHGWRIPGHSAIVLRPEAVDDGE